MELYFKQQIKLFVISTEYFFNKKLNHKKWNLKKIKILNMVIPR